MSALFLPILAFHGIRSDADDRYAIGPELMRSHLQSLQDAGFEGVSLSKGLDLLRKGSLPSRRFVLTVDDGYRDLVTEGLSIAADFGLTGTAFVPVAHVGDIDTWMSAWSTARHPLVDEKQLREVVAAGWEVGSHSSTHRQLDRLPHQALVAEVRDSRIRLEDMIQSSVSTLAYPFGYANGGVRRATRDAGYTWGCSVSNRAASSRDRAFDVPRFEVRSDMNGEALVALIEQRRSVMGDLTNTLRQFTWRQVRRVRERGNQ